MHISQIIEIIQKEMKNQPFILAIEGRCGAGKTTLAAILKEHFDCAVIHMDDFFLQAHQRTEKRLNEAGGNIDALRFEKEVLIPLRNHERFTYQKYDCKIQQLSEVVEVEPKDLTIIEGSYCMHPRLSDYYDCCIFLEIDEEKQRERIIRRNGEKQADIFFKRWIPLEERYFKELDIKSKCNYHFALEETNKI